MDREKVIFFLIYLVLAAGLASCAPKVSVIEEDVRECMILKEKKEEIFKSGVEEGRRLAREEFISNLKEEIEKLKGISGYEEMFREGFLVPPLVVPVIEGATVSDGGKRLSTPRMDWVIVEDAHFTKEDIARALLKRKGLVYIGSFEKYSDAVKVAENIKKEIKESDTVRILKVKGTDDVAIIIETTPLKAVEYADKFRGVIIN